jgi:hypothetical protein
MNDKRPTVLQRYQEWVGANDPSPKRFLWINTLMIGAVSGAIFPFVLNAFMRLVSSRTLEELDRVAEAGLMRLYVGMLLCVFPGGLLYGFLLALIGWYAGKLGDRIRERRNRKRGGPEDPPR